MRRLRRPAVFAVLLGLADCDGAIAPGTKGTAPGGARGTAESGGSSTDSGALSGTQTWSSSGGGASAGGGLDVTRQNGPNEGDSGAGAAGGATADASEGLFDSPSCRPGGAGMTDCGTSRESCCTSLEVTGGTYNRTYSNSGDGPTGEADPATITGFRLDKYLVTVGRFRQFVDAWKSGYFPADGTGKHAHLNDGLGLSNCAAPGGYEAGWDAADWNSQIAATDANLTSGTYVSWTSTAGGNETLPINCENWYEAYAFCIWDGGFLPSEAEFEYAAAGGSQQREYPWGSTDPGTGNQYAIYNCNYPGSVVPFLKNCALTPVGMAALGVGLWGQLDLAGELWEWNLDVWNQTYVDPCVDCTYGTGSCSCRTLRGGTFASDSTEFLAPYRTTAASNPSSEFDTPDTHSDGIGFRCARTP
jgi:formylglycine-generating enzyme